MSAQVNASCGWRGGVTIRYVSSMRDDDDAITGGVTVSEAMVILKRDEL